jgi:hypothetical protein
MKDREQEREYQRQYRKRNRVRLRKYYELHRDHFREASKRRFKYKYHNDKEFHDRYCAYQKQWRANSPRHKQQAKLYRQKNRDQINAQHRAKYHANLELSRKRGRLPALVKNCVICGRFFNARWTLGKTGTYQKACSKLCSYRLLKRYTASPKVRERQRIFYHNNVKHCAAARKLNYEKHRPERLAYAKWYIAAHPAKVHQHRVNRAKRIAIARKIIRKLGLVLSTAEKRQPRIAFAILQKLGIKS